MGEELSAVHYFPVNMHGPAVHYVKTNACILKQNRKNKLKIIIEFVIN
jgi:hypothetical protein